MPHLSRVRGPDAAGNAIGDKGAAALAAALAPRPNLDGSWGSAGLWAGGVGRGALASIDLKSAPTLHIHILTSFLTSTDTHTHTHTHTHILFH
jgi:hypothetical protein